jgi:hypothetical protein
MAEVPSHLRGRTVGMQRTNVISVGRSFCPCRVASLTSSSSPTSARRTSKFSSYFTYSDDRPTGPAVENVSHVKAFIIDLGDGSRRQCRRRLLSQREHALMHVCERDVRSSVRPFEAIAWRQLLFIIVSTGEISIRRARCVVLVH